MLPKAHIILGAIFTFILFSFFPDTNIYNLTLFFLASFLIDFDHYAASVIEDRSNFNLKRSFYYHLEKGKSVIEDRRNGIRKKGTFHLFHTLEFHALVLIAGFFFTPLLFVFLGMLFHSICDILWLKKEDYLYRREFLLTNWIKNKYKKEK